MKIKLITLATRMFVGLSLYLHTLLFKHYRGATQFVNRKASTEMPDYGRMVVQDYKYFLGDIKRDFVSGGSTILEIGTGNSLDVALELASAGNNVTTLDRFQNVTNFSHGVQAFCELNEITFDIISPVSAHIGPGSITYIVQALETHNIDLIKKFDLILSRATLEHVQDPELCVQNIALYSKRKAIHCHEIDHRDHGIFSHFKIFNNLAFHNINDDTWSDMIERYPGIPNKVNGRQFYEIFRTADFNIVSAFCKDDADSQSSKKVDYCDLYAAPVTVLVMDMKAH